MYIDAEKYRSMAVRLRQLAADLGTVRVNMSAIMGFVGDAWQSGASDAFLETSDWTAKDIERLRAEMEDLAADLDAKAEIFEESMHGIVL